MQRSCRGLDVGIRTALVVAWALALVLIGALAVQAEGEAIPPEGMTYTILPGDTLESIAARFGTTVAALLAANDLPNPDLIHYYDELLIVPPGFSGQVSAADAPWVWPDCGWLCTANDVVGNAIWFAKENGAPLDACTPGQPAQAWIWADITNTSNSARYSVTFLGDLYSGGVLVSHLQQCLRDTIPGKQNIVVMVAAVQWTCGPTIEIRNPLLIWNTGAPTTCPGTQVCNDWERSKCFRGSLLPIQGALAADWTATGGCAGNPGQATQFTSDAVGGTGPYSYAWTFGDGGSAAVASPSHTFATAGTYNVTLTVTDAATPTPGVDVTSKRVTVSACPTQPPQPPPTGSLGPRLWRAPRFSGWFRASASSNR